MFLLSMIVYRPNSRTLYAWDNSSAAKQTGWFGTFMMVTTMMMFDF